ncbi:MAG: restriction endonuclease subunit S [Burkholderiales bacterium]|nr:restriction endonuclease subunit S [Burkholderiales bacterium]
MSWRDAHLGDVIRLKRGHDLPASDRVPGEIPIVSSSGVTGFHNVAKVMGPGVVTGRYGTLGEVHYIEGDYWPLNTALYVEDFKSNLPRYVAYLLMTLELGSQNAAGAVPGVNLNTLHQMSVRVPDEGTQRRIVEIVSAYDDLIATNQRRIALLEDAARRLYREWFVHLRFPGHESVQVKDGVPEGWAQKLLGVIAPLNYGKALKSTERKDGNVPVYGSSGIVGTHNVALVDSGGIVVGRKGNVGSLYFSHVPCFPIDTVYYIAPAQASYRLFLAMHHLNFISSDAAVPGLNRAYAHSLPVLQPAEDVADTFERLVRPVFEQVQQLTEQNAKLAQTRDLLLPKLMSGQLDVSGIALPQAEHTEGVPLQC